MVWLIQLVFAERKLPKELTWENIVLLPKGKGGYQGIRLVEVAWKLCAVVLNLRLKKGVELHDSLHGFRYGRGTGTATLESNIFQQLARLAHELLFQVFLDVRKVYDLLNIRICLYILTGYGMGPNLACILNHYREK